MKTSPKARKSSNGETLLKGIFAVLIAYVLANVALGLASLPEFYERVSTMSVGVVAGPDGEPLVSDAIFTEAARERGMSMPVYAAYHIALNVGNTLVLGTLAALVLWRARREWFGWFTACIIIFLGSYSLSEATWVASELPFWVLDSGVLLWTLYLLYFFLFPNGRAAPRRAKSIAGVFFTVQVSFLAAYFFGAIFPGFLPRWMSGPLTTVTIVLTFVYFAFIISCQVYRYRYVSDSTERQQTKWFVFGMGFVVLTWPFAIVWDFPFETEFFLVTNAILPLNIAIAMMRYRLFDVDTLINRALVYLSLTVLLGATYLGFVVSLQYVFRSVTGEESQIVIVASTLVIAAMFVPLRRRLQSFIDHRFYRSRYDSRRVIEEFSKRLRNETDIEILGDDLHRVVKDTMQPAHVSVWLRTPEEAGERR